MHFFMFVFYLLMIAASWLLGLYSFSRLLEDIFQEKWGWVVGDALLLIASAASLTHFINLI